MTASCALPECWSHLGQGRLRHLPPPALRNNPRRRGLRPKFARGITTSPAGVEIPEDIAFMARDPKFLPKNTLAQYFGRRFAADERISWETFVNADEQVAVRFSKEILSSDEAVVAVFAHEMHELSRLRALFDIRETIPATEVLRLINPGIKGNLHDQAWEVADAIVARMRASKAEIEIK
jgi:hypothetical protein